MVYIKNNNTLVIEYPTAGNAMMELHYLNRYLNDAAYLLLLNQSEHNSVPTDVLITLNKLCNALSLSEQQLETLGDTISAQKNKQLTTIFTNPHK